MHWGRTGQSEGRWCLDAPVHFTGHNCREMPGIRALGGLCEIIQIMYDIDVSQSTTQKYLVPIILRTILRLIKIIQDLYDALREFVWFDCCCSGLFPESQDGCPRPGITSFVQYLRYNTIPYHLLSYLLTVILYYRAKSDVRFLRILFQCELPIIFQVPAEKYVSVKIYAKPDRQV